MSVREYVAGFAFCLGHVALIQKLRPDWQRGKYNGIGGHIEAGELPHVAMAREFQEEAGLETSCALWEHFATLEDGRALNGKDGHAWRVYWYRIELSTEDFAKIRTTGDERVCLFDLDELPVTVIPNLNWLIPLAADNQRHDWPLHVIEHAVPIGEASLGPQKGQEG